MPVTETSRPKLWKVARVDYDRVRQRPVILYPEGALFINDTARAILELCDGNHSVSDIARILGERYRADVTADVVEFVESMAGRDLVTLPQA